MSYVVMEYESMNFTASCRINHTFVRHYAGRTKLNKISGFYFYSFFLKILHFYIRKINVK